MEPQPLADRVRSLLSGKGALREVRMFGGLSFMVDDAMVVAVRAGDDLLVRVDPGRYDELVARPGVRQAEMGSGRSMGPGWLQVSQDALDDEQLSWWLDVALEHRSAGGSGR